MLPRRTVWATVFIDAKIQELKNIYWDFTNLSEYELIDQLHGHSWKGLVHIHFKDFGLLCGQIPSSRKEIKNTVCGSLFCLFLVSFIMSVFLI